MTDNLVGSSDLSTYAVTGPPTGTLAPEWVDVLHEIGQQFASSLDLDEVLSKVLSQTVNVVGATGGSVFLLDAQGAVQRSIITRRDLLPTVRNNTIAVVMGRGLAGWVYQRKQAVILPNAQSDERWYVFPDDPIKSHSVMAAPMLRRNTVIGIITLVHAEVNHFTKKQLELLEAITSQAASAVENAALYTRVNDERSVLQAVIGGVQDIIIVTDMHHQLVMLNAAARRQLALFEAQPGQPIALWLTEPSLSTFYAAAQHETHFLRQVALTDGRVFDCASMLIPNVGRVWSMHDVTQFKQLDQMKNEFVAHVSHDLKAPLSVMHGYADLLLSLDTLAPDEENYVRTIMDSARHMQSLIDSLLDLSQLEQGLTGDFEKVDLRDVVAQALDQLAWLALDKNITLATALLDEPLWVRGTLVRLGQAVANLVSNAIKFSPVSSTVSVTLQRQPYEASVVVQDEGPGVPAHLQNKIFQKFSRLNRDRANEGHGLGLSIVKSVVELHGGRLWIESPLNAQGGSRFAFALPLWRSSPSAD